MLFFEIRRRYVNPIVNNICDLTKYVSDTDDEFDLRVKILANK